jgi:hypothetical protein
MNALRLEALLVAQQRLRHQPLANTGHLFEIERAIDEIQGGCSCSHTETVEIWTAQFLAGVAA